MVIDYKDVSFSFDKIKKRKRQQRTRLIIVAVILIFLYILLANALDYGKIKKVRNLLLEGEIHRAAAFLEDISSSLFHRNSKRELNALTLLFSNRYEEAQSLMDSLLKKSTLTEHELFLHHLSDRAEYKKLQIYVYYLNKKKQNKVSKDSLLFYQAQAKTGQLLEGESTELLKQISPEFRKENEKAISILGNINRQIKKGRINYVFDINGKPLAYYDFDKKTTDSLVPGISFAGFNEDIRESIKFYHLTIDRGIQKKVNRLFRNYHGSFLLMDVTDSSIVAAYSKPLGKRTDIGNRVFSENYEPGSIIKLLTMFTYLNALQSSLSGPSSGSTQTDQAGKPALTVRSEVTNIFPFQCKGTWTITEKDGSGGVKKRIFYDWLTHHRVENCEEALAISCNIAFAKMGTLVGASAMGETLNRFYFNSPPQGTPFKDLFLTFKTGTFSKDISISDNYRLANLAVGLNEISITTFHAALLAAVVSQNGSIYEPYMIKNKKNLLNIAFYNHLSRLGEIYKANAVFFKIKEGMRLAVESDRGTGKRAQTDFVSVALKTGTAGNKKLGLDAILTGFFPAEKPQYAFAFRLERAGKAELHGALFLKKFLSTFYPDRKSKTSKVNK